MFLRKLYTEPISTFGVIEFTDGVNFIFGKKDKEGDTRDSLNGIGKSLLLDLIDFCLISRPSERLKFAQENEFLIDTTVVLEFEVGSEAYKIKRNTGKPNTEIEFISGDKTQSYTEKEIKPVLCNLIFRNESYSGVFHDTWLRKLLPFFIKIQNTKKDRFLDPIKYSEDKKMELIQYHFFFLGIDNAVFEKNFKLQSELKKKAPALKEIRSIIEETYGLKKVDDANNEIDILNEEIAVLEKAIATFKLASQYEDVEAECNKLTVLIKDLWYQNFVARKKIESFRESYRLDVNISPSQVSEIYNELSNTFSVEVKKTLQEAIDFRKKLSLSRKEFLSKEIETLEKSISSRDLEIADLEDKRSKLFVFLATKEAIKDLSDAYLQISKKREKLNQLEGKVDMYNTFVSEKADLQTEETVIYKEIIDFLKESKDALSSFRKNIMDVYNAIYPESKRGSVFSVSPNDRLDAKVEIDVTFPADLSKGKNQGRTLVYDLAILFHGIQNDLKGPRFLIHDGIFDGMDKGHFVHLYEYLEEKLLKTRFQYIVTLNEEGTLGDNFGHAEKVSPGKISDMAVKVLTPTKTLLGRKY